MKKLILLSLIFSVPAGVFAEYRVWKSSNVTVATNNVRVLCSGGQRGVFHGVCTDFGVASSSMTIHNSSWTIAGTQAAGPISTLVADQCKYYDIVTPAGLSYFKNNAAAVSILYDCF